MSSKFLMNANDLIEISDVKGLQEELDEIQEEIAGGGGGISYDAGSVVQGNGIVFRNGTDADKVKNAQNFSLVNLPGIGDSLLCNDIQFPSIYSAETTINDNKEKLTKITYDGATQITTINGELDVDKIKNTNGTAEVELETDGKINIVGDGKVKIQATSTTGDFDNALSLETGTNCYITATKGIYLNALSDDNTRPNITLNANYGLLTIQAINGYIQNLTQGLIRLENIPPNPVVERNGFIFNPDAVRVDLNKLDVSKGHIGLDTNENMEIKSASQLVLESANELYITSQSNNNTYSLGNMVLSADGSLSLQSFGGYLRLSSNGNNIQFFTGGGGSVLWSDVPAVPHALTNKAYVDSAIRYFPEVTTFRLPKNPARPALTDPVYEDDVLKLGWDNPNGNDLEVVFKTGSSSYNSYCYMPGTTSLTKATISSKNTKVDLNSFVFSGGQKMVADLVPIEAQSTAPKYIITLFFTEDTIGIDGDIDFRIEKFLHQI